MNKFEGYSWNKLKKTEQSTEPSNSPPRQGKEFFWEELFEATNAFSEENEVGGGTYSIVYKGCLADGSMVAIKRLRPECTTYEYQKYETGFISQGSMPAHPNLLPLLGSCMTPQEKLLVFPFMVNGDLQSCLSKSEHQLDWQTRKRIVHGTAVALDYLHNYYPKIIHRNVKPSKILLNENFQAVVGGYDLVKRDTSVRGAFANLAPEYFLYGICSEKTDVFGYGILLFEVITGGKHRQKAPGVTILDWIKELGDYWVEIIVDDDLRGNYASKEAEELIHVASRCIQISPDERPKMSEVVQMLEDLYRFSTEDIKRGMIMRDDAEEDTEEDTEEDMEEDTEEQTETDTIQLSDNGITDLLEQPISPTDSKHSSAVLPGTQSREPLNSPSYQVKEFLLDELIEATSNFSVAKQLGSGLGGVVYEGCLADGTKVAIKRLSNSSEVETEFKKETSMPLHPNLLPLLGFCESDTPKERLLVFPLMVNGNLRSCLKPSKSKPSLDWKTRKRIAYGTALALAYLHDECKPSIIHRDIKPENILVNENFEAVVADFGFVRTIDPAKSSAITNNICGTAGFIAPEYWKYGLCSKKSDVYAYGVLLFEIITGDTLHNILPENVKVTSISPFSWIRDIVENMGAQNLVDSDLQGKYSTEEAEKLISVALKCTRKTREKRPEMYVVCIMLERAFLQ